MTIHQSLFAILLLVNYAFPVFASEFPCGDWEPFKNELCYKVFTSVALESYEKAEKTCMENGATLIDIPNLEMQQFLVEFIFKRSKVVDTVWIGAQFVEGKFHWTDKSNLTYSNWARGSPKKLANYCVQMQSDVGSYGKWDDVPCTKKNLVVCQKKATLSLAQMKELLFQLKHELKDSLAAVNETLKQTDAKLADAKQELANTRKELSSVKESLIPIGFIYVQLPKAPSEIWPRSITWKDVSGNYGGVFFRVQGGEAAPFGQVQACHAPRMEQIMSGDSANIKAKIEHWNTPDDVPQVGWSSGYPTGGLDGTFIYTKFKFSDLAEVRPVNMAVKVWKRTA